MLPPARRMLQLLSTLPVKRMKPPAFWRFRLASTIVVAAAAACGSRSQPNHFIVPPDYLGPIAVVTDPSFESETYWDGARHIHRVPASGIVCVTDDDMLRPLFRLTAEYSTGVRIPSIQDGGPSPSTGGAPRIEALGSWGSGSEGRYVHWFAVGSHAEIQALKTAVLGVRAPGDFIMPSGALVRRWDNADFGYLRTYCGSGGGR